MQAVSVCDGHGERCPIKSHHARPIAHHEGAVLGLQGLGRPQGHQLCQCLGAAMVRRSCSLAWAGASSASGKRSNGSAPTLSQACWTSSSWAAKRDG